MFFFELEKGLITGVISELDTFCLMLVRNAKTAAGNQFLGWDHSASLL